jgi:uncharacterized protein
MMTDSALPAVDATAPRLPSVHMFRSEARDFLLVADGSRVYALEPEVAPDLRNALEGRDAAAADRLLDRLELRTERPFVDDQPIQSPPLRALSLAISQKCNLACTYCYADGGGFGSPPRNMSEDVALAAVERLFEQIEPGQLANLSFLGGEPLVNREVLRKAVLHAETLAARNDAKIGFSITTNGTLVTPDDGSFFEEHGFAVTVSLDGLGEVHDLTRRSKSGVGTYQKIVDRIRPLLAMQRRMQVSARVTVTPDNLRLRETLDGLIAMGFHSVGFSPVLRSVNGTGEMTPEALQKMLAQMIDCAQEFERATVAGQRYPFSNVVTALHEIHRGTHRPYPCGAGASYLGVSAEGSLSACHRFVGDEHGQLGSLADGVDVEAQNAWLAERHVHRQEPCRSCWARYLCGGGCHHEVIARGRPACDFIRGWLHVCLQTYARLLRAKPDYFGA